MNFWLIWRHRRGLARSSKGAWNHRRGIAQGTIALIAVWVAGIALVAAGVLAIVRRRRTKSTATSQATTPRTSSVAAVPEAAPDRAAGTVPDVITEDAADSFPASDPPGSY